MSRTRTRLLLVGLAALMLAAACMPAASPSPSSPLSSGIEGLVLAGPTCPVQRVDESPCVRPLSAVVIVVTGSTGAEVARTTTDSNGRFRIALPAGTYAVHPQPAAGVLGTGRDQSVRVLPSAFTPITIDYDTGIR